MSIFRCGMRRGSLVLEAAVSVMILSIAAAFIVNAHISCNRSIKSRIINEDLTRNIENIKREIQYNLSRSELDDIFTHNKLGLRYSENFGRDILNKRLNELDKGQDILIELKSQDSESMKFRIKAEVKDGEVFVNLDEEFEKSWWMNED